MAFQDRIVEYPNRVTLTAVSGETDTYDMARAEGTVTQEGTPLNAENLNAEIASAVAEALGGITIDNSGNVSFRNLQSGRALVPYKAKAVTSTKVNFPKAFTKVPRVTASIETVAPNITAMGITAITTTGFTVNIFRNANATGNIYINWIAHV